MILIQSKNSELNTNAVIEWLISFNVPFVRYNFEDFVDIQAFKISSLNVIDLTIKINDQELDFNSITSYWHRRGKIKIKCSESLQKIMQAYFPAKKAEKVSANIKSQIQGIESYLNDRLADLPFKIGNSKLSNINKLTVLECAKLCTLDIPETIITSSKLELKKFKKEKKDIITKSILDSLFLWDDNENIIHYTEMITTSFINTLPDTFALSLFQEAVDKKFELRVFYLKGLFYSMAIFSQSDSQTSVDFRKYNDSKPNRTVPYLLPTEIAKKLDKLMKRLNLDTGSIDLIVSQTNTYYFLEVNPVGQFGMVSYPCNYYIEKEIALYLSKQKYHE